MKLGFPLKNRNELAPDFAHAEYVGIYDLESRTTSMFTINSFTMAPSEVFGMLCSQKLYAVVCPFYSFLSLRVFKENNIKTFKSKGKSIEENLSNFLKGNMHSFDIYESLLTGECAKDCLGCSTDENCETSRINYN